MQGQAAAEEAHRSAMSLRADGWRSVGALHSTSTQERTSTSCIAGMPPEPTASQLEEVRGFATTQAGLVACAEAEHCCNCAREAEHLPR